MGSLEDLPQRGGTHDVADAAERAFANAFAGPRLFILQGCDRHDYGSDVVVEAIREGAVTNVRVQAQLKGTTCAPNADGSVSIPVSRSTLNYLLNQPSSIFVCFHLPSGRLLARYAEDVYAEYEHGGDDWLSQQTVTIRFQAAFDDEFQIRLHRRTLATGLGHRDTRLDWAATPPEQAAALVRQTPRLIEVPPDPNQARRILQALYDAGEDSVISASFMAFAAVLDGIEGALDVAYMAEINLGLNQSVFDDNRVRRAIDVLHEAEGSGRIASLSARYCEGNARLALREYAVAIKIYSGILQELETRDRRVAAMCAKNLGSAQQGIGDLLAARRFYERALELDPDLGEANFALAMCARREGDIRSSLTYLDRVAPSRQSAIRMPGVTGWRVELLFQAGDPEGAFREISNLLGQVSAEKWIWPWCARQVATHGRATVDSTKQALRFWNSFLKEHPGMLAAKRQRVLCLSRLDHDGVGTGCAFEAFASEATELIAAGDAHSALLWDLVGHWAQRQGKWPEAETAFRHAYELDSERFAYCLATALNFLDRYDEALHILYALPLATLDAQSWFQAAVAHEGVGDLDGAVTAYQVAIALDPAYDVAWFNLGGLMVNAGDLESARQVWSEAISLFPQHDLAKKILYDFTFLFKEIGT